MQCSKQTNCISSSNRLADIAAFIGEKLLLKKPQEVKKKNVQSAETRILNSENGIYVVMASEQHEMKETIPLRARYIIYQICVFCSCVY